MDTRIRNIVLQAIASPDFVFHFTPLDEYWTTLTTSTNPWVRDALEHVGDGRIAPCVFSLLVNRWAGEPVKLLKMVCQALVSNLVFSAILMSVGAYRGRIRNSNDVKIVADNFESYVAAFARQYGTKRLKSWVFGAFGPLVDSIRSACTATILSPLLVNASRIRSRSAEPARTATTATGNRLHALGRMESWPAPVTKKASENDAPKSKVPDENEPLPGKTKVQIGKLSPPEPRTPALGDKTNGQVSGVPSRSTTKPADRLKETRLSPMPASLEAEAETETEAAAEPEATAPMPTPASSQAETALTLLQRMQIPSTFVGRPPPRRSLPDTLDEDSADKGPPTVLVSLLPWWTSSGVFASAMKDGLGLE